LSGVRSRERHTFGRPHETPSLSQTLQTHDGSEPRARYVISLRCLLSQETVTGCLPSSICLPCSLAKHSSQPRTTTKPRSAMQPCNQIKQQR
jgi:hypothetical protein